MKIVVLVKEVPDMERVKFDSEKGTVNRASAEGEINPFDLNALQAAVQIKQDLEAQGGDCTITALTMGPPKAEKTMRDIYARGADACVLLTDRQFGGADTLATSQTLAAAIQAQGGADLILCGEKTVDGDTAQVGAEVAELLDLPHSCYVEQICMQPQAVEVVLDEISGSKQRRRMELPALLCVTKNVAYPQIPTVKRKLRSLEVEIQTLGLADLAPYVTAQEVGAKGSPTKVVKIEVPKSAVKKNVRFNGDYQGFHAVFSELAQQYM